MGRARQPQHHCNNSLTHSTRITPNRDDFWRDAGNATSPPRLLLTNASLPLDTSGAPIDPDAGGYNALRGFSPLGPVLSFVPGLSLDRSALPRLWSIPSSLGAGARSVVLNAATGAPVAHWVELDDSSGATSTPYERALMLWPAARLADSTRFIVAFRSLVDDAGVPIAASDGFAALRDGVPTDSPAVEAARPRFESIFAALGAAGWARENVTLAWDFTTNDAEDVTDRFLSMRDDAFARIAAAGGVKYTISGVENAPAANTSRRVKGSFQVRGAGGCVGAAVSC